MDQIFQVMGLGGGVSQVILIGTLLVIRIVAIVFQTPFLGGKLIPPETRIGISVGLAVLTYPFAKARLSGPIDVNSMVYITLMFKELFIGFAIGFLAAELFYAMEFAGRALDVMRGSNMAEVQVPELQLRASPLGEFNFQLLLVIFCALNGHGFFIESVIESFDIVPVDSWPKVSLGFEPVVNEVLAYTSNLFGLAFALVFPGLFATFVTDLVFGMFNRVAPQLNAYAMAMGVKAMAGLAMFMFTISLLIGELSTHLERSLLFVRRVIGMLG